MLKSLKIIALCYPLGSITSDHKEQGVEMGLGKGKVLNQGQFIDIIVKSRLDI